MNLDGKATNDSARKNFNINGETIRDWAVQHNFSVGLVYQVLNGKRKCLRGQSHQIAVKLGLKG